MSTVETLSGKCCLFVGVHLGCTCMRTHVWVSTNARPYQGTHSQPLRVPTLLEKCHGAVIRATMVVQGQLLPIVCSALGVGLAGIAD